MGDVSNMNIMCVGDTHGNRGWTKAAIKWASENDIDRIVQVGDFGFWPRTNNGQKFLHEVGKASVEARIPFYFIDGNHEDHLELAALRRRNVGEAFMHYGKHPLTYITRGARWEWGGVWFGAFGGAFSIDRWGRVQDSGSYGWFQDEVPDRSKIEALGKVDVLITHDSPIVPPIIYRMGQNFKADDTSRESQHTVYDALAASGADLLIHGHWHVNERYSVQGATVQGLDCDGTALHEGAVVFRTDDRRLFGINEWGYRDEQATTTE